FEPPVGAREECRRRLEAERLRGLQVDHRLVFHRRLHWQVGRLGALEDAVDVSRRPAVVVALIGPVGDQAAGVDEVAEWIDRGQLVAGPPRAAFRWGGLWGAG